ncbi:MAG: hypothetical protein HYR85_22405 [Planctomycetes bacterium]|nr:hypothetical protein [Planctomycetota bacterium]MBI3844137.1 hypothetical protein [Planctomycetota bacterium]
MPDFWFLHRPHDRERAARRIAQHGRVAPEGSWRFALVARALALPAVSLGVAVIPGVGAVFYGGHTLGTLLLLPSLGWVTYWVVRDVIRATLDHRRAHLRFGVAMIAIYVVATYPAAWLAALGVHPSAWSHAELAANFRRALAFPIPLP